MNLSGAQKLLLRAIRWAGSRGWDGRKRSYMRDTSTWEMVDPSLVDGLIDLGLVKRVDEPKTRYYLTVQGLEAANRLAFQAGRLREAEILAILEDRREMSVTRSIAIGRGEQE
jgi:hypothetical protein